MIHGLPNQQPLAERRILLGTILRPFVFTFLKPTVRQKVNGRNHLSVSGSCVGAWKGCAGMDYCRMDMFIQGWLQTDLTLTFSYPYPVLYQTLSL
nr:hypothetical protein Q903MT_gene5129 [Picea sitchensis]